MDAKPKPTLTYAVQFVRARLIEQTANLARTCSDEITDECRRAAERSIHSQMGVLWEVEYVIPRIHERSQEWQLARSVVRCLASPFFDHPDAPDAPDGDWWVT